MAWATPKTWVTGETVTAAEMNQDVRDNLKALNPDDTVSAASWAPTLKAATTNPTTGGPGGDPIVATGRQWRVGPVQFVWARWLFGATVSAGSGFYFVDLPVSASGVNSSSSSFDGQVIGSWHAGDNSDTLNNTLGTVQLRTASQVIFPIAGGGIVNNNTPFAWFDSDVLTMHAAYPVA